MFFFRSKKKKPAELQKLTDAQFQEIYLSINDLQSAYLAVRLKELEIHPPLVPMAVLLEMHQSGNYKSTLPLGIMYFMDPDTRNAALSFFTNAPQSPDVKLYKGVCNLATDVSNGLALIREAAEEAVPHAQYVYGLCVGFLSIEAEKRVDWLSRAAFLGYERAQFKVGRCFLEGDGVAQNGVVGLDWVRQAAENGFSDALVFLGKSYQTGEYTERNPKVAQEYFLQAAAQHNADALFELSEIALRANPDDFNEAYKFLLQSAELFHVPSLLRLGTMYLVQNLDHEAFQQFLLAVKYSHCEDADALYHLGLCYLYGLGTGIDVGLALPLLRLSCDKGNNEARCTLAQYILKNRNNQQAAIAKAYELLALAADENHTESQFLYGMHLIRNGNMEKGDHLAGAHYIRAAAKKDHLEATYQAGLLFLRGRGVKKNDCRAFEWFLKAAEKGHEMSIRQVVHSYQHGIGTDIDLAESVRWMEVLDNLDSS